MSSGHVAIRTIGLAWIGVIAFTGGLVCSTYHQDRVSFPLGTLWVGLKGAVLYWRFTLVPAVVVLGAGRIGTLVTGAHRTAWLFGLSTAVDVAVSVVLLACSSGGWKVDWHSPLSVLIANQHHGTVACIVYLFLSTWAGVHASSRLAAGVECDRNSRRS